MKKPVYLLFLLFAMSTRAQNRLFAYSDGHKWGLTNENLDVLATPQFDAGFFVLREGYALVQKDKKWGTLGADGKIIIPCNYERVTSFDAATGYGIQNGKYLLLNFRTGEPVTPDLFDNIDEHCAGTPTILVVTQRGKKGFLNATIGKPINKISYDDAHFLWNFKLRGSIKKNGKYGMIDLATGKIILPIHYDKLETTTRQGKEVIAATRGSLIGYFDQDGKATESPVPIPASRPAEDTDKTFTVIAPPVGDSPGGEGVKDLYIYSQGNDNWKLSMERRSRTSTVILETYTLSGYSKLERLDYNKFNPSKPVIVKAIKDGKAGIINLSGKVLVPFLYDNITYDNGFFKTFLDNKVGMLNLHFSVLTQPVLKDVLSNAYGLRSWFVEMPDGRKGYMDDTSGKIFIPGMKD